MSTEAITPFEENRAAVMKQVYTYITLIGIDLFSASHRGKDEVVLEVTMNDVDKIEIARKDIRTILELYEAESDPSGIKKYRLDEVAAFLQYLYSTIGLAAIKMEPEVRIPVNTEILERGLHSAVLFKRLSDIAERAVVQAA